jgi:hypothetical protein
MPDANCHRHNQTVTLRVHDFTRTAMRGGSNLPHLLWGDSGLRMMQLFTLGRCPANRHGDIRPQANYVLLTLNGRSKRLYRNERSH